MLLKKLTSVEALQWLSFMFSTLIAGSYAVTACVKETNIETLSSSSPYYITSSTSITTGFATPEICLDQCSLLKYSYTLIESAALCHCSTADTVHMEAATTLSSCDKTCGDGSECGATSQNYLTKMENTAPPSSGYIVITQPLDSPTVDSNEIVTLVFDTSGPNLLIFEDGEQIAYTGSASHDFQRTYPGLYTITEILQGQPMVRKTIKVIVAQDPQILNECPLILEPETPMPCSTKFPKQGSGSVFSFSLGPSSNVWLQEDSYKIPDDILFLDGVRPIEGYINTEKAIELGTLILLANSYSSERRYLTRIVSVYDGIIPGTIGIFAVQPTCSAGTFCPTVNLCMASDCPVIAANSLTCDTYFCPATSTCATESNPCATGTAPDEKTKSWTLLRSVELLSGDFELETAVEIPAGTTLAFGCRDLTDCPVIPVIHSRDIAAGEQPDYLIRPGISAEVVEINYKHIFQLMGRLHPVTDVLQDLTCAAHAPVPNSRVVDKGFTVDSKEAEEFALQSDLSYIYKVTTSHSNTIISNTDEGHICQLPVGVPVMETDIRMPLGDPYAFDITFTGSPIFNSMNMDGIMHYRYQDDATGGYIYTSNLVYAIGGHYTLEGTVSNKLNYESYSVAVHVIPKIPDIWVLSIACPCFNIVDGVDLTIDMASTANPPWTASVSYDMNGDVLLAPEDIDFQTESNGGIAQALSITRKAIFTDAGEKIITVTLSNEFSTVTTSQTITVQEAIKDVSVELKLKTIEGIIVDPPGDIISTFPSKSNIVIRITSTGTPEKYRCIVDELQVPIPSDTNELELVINEDGEYTLLCDAYNTVQGWISAPPKKILIASKLQGFGIEDSLLTASNDMTKEILATFLMYISESCVKIDFNDTIKETYGNEELCRSKYPHADYVRSTHSAPIKVVHTYIEENIYDVTGIAFANGKEFTAACQIIAATVPCKMPSAFIINPSQLPTNPLRLFKSMPFGLEAKSEIDCTEKVDIKSFWTATEVDPATGTGLMEHDISSIPSSKLSSVQIPARFLDYAVYKMSFEINIPLAIKVLKFNAHTFVKIVKTPLIASITEGGETRFSRGLGQRIHFNFAKTADPDEPDGDQEELGLKIKFFCRKLNSEMYPIDLKTQTYMDPSRQDIPVVPPTVSTGEGCFGNGLQPIAYPDLSFVLFSMVFITAPETYEFALQVSKDTRISVAFLQVEVENLALPLIYIKCGNPDNCISHDGNTYINPSVRINLIGEINTTATDSLGYDWKIYDMNKNEVELKLSYCLKNDEVCRKSSELSLSKELFADNPTIDQYVFRLTGIDGNGNPGFSEIVLTINKPPRDGKCDLVQNEGKVLITKFRVECTGWKDPENIGIQSYTYYYSTLETENSIEKTILSTQESMLDLILPHGKMAMFVEIKDKLEATTKVSLGNVIVIMPTQQEVNEYNVEEKLQQATINNNGNYISQLILAFNSIEVNADWLDLTNTNNAESLTELKRTISASQQSQLKIAFETMTIETVPQIKSASSLLLSMVESVFKNDAYTTNLNLESKNLATALTEKIIAALKTAPIVSVQELVPIIDSLTDSMNAMICSSNLIAEIEEFSPTELEIAPLLEYDSELDEVTIVSGNVSEQHKENVIDTTIERSKAQVDSIVKSIHVIYEEIVKRVAPGELVVSNSANFATIIIGKVYEADFRNGGVNLSSNVLRASVDFPDDFCPSKFINPKTDCKQWIQIKFIVWPCIPYFYPKSVSHLSTGANVNTVELYLDGKLININNETPMTVTIPKMKERNEILAPLITPSFDSSLNMVYHKFSLNEQHTAFLICIAAESNTFIGNDVIYIQVDSLPLPYEYAYANRIVDLSTNDDGYYELFVNIENITRKTNDIYIGIVQLTGKVDVTTDLNKTYEDLSKIFDTKYSLKTFSVGCFFFNVSTSEWSTEGLEVKFAGSNTAVCITYHFSSFSIGYFPTINTLNFEYIFANVGFVDNLTLYITLIIFTSLFVIMIIWGHYQDRKDAEKRGAIPLTDNKLNDKYLYELTFWTGPDKEASTMSNIMIIVSGELGETDIRELPSGDKNLYRRFEVNSFVMATKRPLGIINYLRVFHDNSGEPPLDSWELQRVVIRDIQTSEKFLFECNTWLALDRSDGYIDKTFNRSFNADGKNYSERFYLKGNRILNDDHIWLSIFMRSVGSRYTRKERVLVCAAFLYISMVASALWYDTLKETDIEGYFRIGAFSFTTEILTVSLVNLLVVFPITTILIFIFKRARPRKLNENRALEGIQQQRFSQLKENGYDDNLAELQCKLEKEGHIKQKEKAPRNTLPWCTRLLAWIVTVLLICASGFYVWAYGVQWGEIKTVKWFSSFLFSFFISVLVLQFIKALVIACISGFIKNDNFFTEDMDCDEELPSLKADEEWKYVNALDPSYRKKVHNIQGVNIEERRVAALRARLFKEREMKFVLRNLAKYFLFLAILFIIVNSRTDQKAYRMKTHLLNTFLKPGHLKHDFVGLIKNSNDWWKWCKEVVLQELRAHKLYNGDQPYGLKGYLDDHSNRIMGYGIIRQVRTRKGECYATPPMNKVIYHCGGVRGESNEDTRHFCKGWEWNETDTGSCDWKEFQYRSATELQTYTTSGLLGTYGGGGYVLKLRGNMDYLLGRMESLHEAGWLDQHTKALMLEFSLFNPNANLFATCIVMAEFKEGGGIVPYWRFEPIRLIPNSGWTGIVSRVAEILFCIATVFFSISELWEMKKSGCSYFDSYWNRAEITVILISYLTIGLYIVKYMLTAEATAEFERSNGDAYVRMDIAALIDQCSLYTIGMVVFFSILKLIRLLQFNNKMNLLALTIKRSWDELKIFLLAFAIVFFAFSCLFYFMFGSDLQQFATIIGSVMTCFVMMMGKFDYEDMNRINPLSPLLFFLFSVVNSFILINLMLSIIINTFSQLKYEMTFKENKLDVIDYAWTSFKQRIRKEKFSQRHVMVNLKDQQNESKGREESANELPVKVDQLLEQMNQMYFDGRLDMNDPSSKSLFHGNNTVDADPMGQYYKHEINYND